MWRPLGAEHQHQSSAALRSSVFEAVAPGRPAKQRSVPCPSSCPWFGSNKQGEQRRQPEVQSQACARVAGSILRYIPQCPAGWLSSSQVQNCTHCKIAMCL